MGLQQIKKINFLRALTVLAVVVPLSACELDDGSNVGTVTVAWTPPDQRVNGDGLSPADIGGYRVYYGKVPGDYPNRVSITDGTAQEGTVTALHGLYFYVMTTLDTLGRESEFSVESEVRI